MATYNGSTVEVNTFLSGRPISTQNFEFPMVVVPHNLTTGVVDSFSSLNGVVGSGAAVNSPLYMFTSGLKGGTAAPSLVKIARATLTSVTVTVDSVPAVGEKIAVNANINGRAEVVSFEIVTADDKNAAAAGLEAALKSAYSGEKIPAFSVSGNVITATVTPDTFKTSLGWATLTAAGVPHVTVEDVTSDPLVDVLKGAADADDDFSFILAEGHTSADQVALAAYAEANDKQYYTSTSEAGVKDNTSQSNVALTLGALGQDTVSLQYSAVANQVFPESCVVGNTAAISPFRANNPNLMTLKGVPVDKLTETEIVTLTKRNVNYYVSEYGSGAYHEGWTMGGNFTDFIRFAQWYEAKCEEALYLLFKQASDRNSSVPYSDVGKLQMESRVRNDVINLGIRGGTIATGTTEDPVTGDRINLDPIIDFGTRAQQSNSDITQRVWGTGMSEVVYVSGINHVKLNNYIIVNRDPA
tara:strand:+ start:1604 stop:3013 length:1410 start_codon:yes stop_codon:yes gene_type:complete